MNTAIAITAIIAATLLANSIVVAIAKHAAANRADAAAIDRARTLHRKATHGDDCVHCAAFGPGYDNTWPCQTIRALNGAPTKENSA
ncbi:hypothetical protein [Streptomyces ipomoeae]|uniref:hypothetical protein n=1 Tax=Streptomyces ipomoeae TaxID=103232 RepID=UPI0029AC9827|nr:hypothetical protein [Streptomyces ipomoeae]MDX2697108.1 hypothetical protein [Streptomyces ipomoeae]